MDNSELTAKVIEHGSKIEGLEREVGTLNKAIFTGNGQPSLTSRMSSIETQLSSNSKVLMRAAAGVYTLLFGFVFFVLKNMYDKVYGV